MLKKYFVPEARNNFRPHFLRRPAVLAILGLILIVELVFLLPTLVIFPHSNFLAAVLPDALVSLTNKDRAGVQVKPLIQNSLLTQAAELKASDMARRGYFSHTSPEGEPPWVWLKRVGYRYAYAGENLAINFFDSADVARAWLNSPTHRANVLRDKFTEIGIGVARGNYRGQESVFVVEFFGTPAGANLGPTKMGQPLAAALPAAVGAIPSMWLSQPHTLTATLYWWLGALVLLALLSAIFIKIKIQHPDLIVNGFLILALIATILVANQTIASRHAELSDVAATTVLF